MEEAARETSAMEDIGLFVWFGSSYFWWGTACLIAGSGFSVDMLGQMGAVLCALAWLRCLWAPARERSANLVLGGLLICLLFGVPLMGGVGAVVGLLFGAGMGILGSTPLWEGLWKGLVAGVGLTAGATLVMALGQALYWLRCRWFGKT